MVFIVALEGAGFRFGIGEVLRLKFARGALTPAEICEGDRVSRGKAVLVLTMIAIKCRVSADFIILLAAAFSTLLKLFRADF